MDIPLLMSHSASTFIITSLIPQITGESNNSSFFTEAAIHFVSPALGGSAHNATLAFMMQSPILRG